jgi:hypothetical protein
MTTVKINWDEGGKSKFVRFDTEEPVSAVLNGVGGASRNGGLYIINGLSGEVASLALAGRYITSVEVL